MEPGQTAEQSVDSPPTFGTPTALASIVAFVRGLFSSEEAFGLPENFVRACLALLLIGAQLWMQWQSPTEGTVPPALVAAAGLATGFYLTGSASPTMKAVVSMVYVGAFVAFLLVHGWVPEAINSQVTIVVGIYYGAKIRPPNGGKA